MAHGLSPPTSTASSHRRSLRFGAPSDDVHAIASWLTEQRPPAGHLRVADVGANPGRVTYPYLEVGARVVAIVDPDADIRQASPHFHAVLRWTSSDEGAGLRPDDLDLVFWTPSRRACEDQERARRRVIALRAALAPGGLFVVRMPVGADSSAIVHALHDAGVVSLDMPTPPDVLVRTDGRPPDPTPAVLEGLDRTMCVDRAAVLLAASRPPWRGPASAPVSATADALVQALRSAVEAGDLRIRDLPWPSLERPSDGPSGCDLLAIMPHPDDESIYAGGTLAGEVHAGRRVHLVTATAGAAGRGSANDGTSLAAIRAAELLEACAILGIEHAECLGWPDTGKYLDAHRSRPAGTLDAIRAWGLERCLADLVRVLRSQRPRRVLTLDPEIDPNYSLHGHHTALGLLCAVAVHLTGDEAIECTDREGRALAAWRITEHRVLAPEAHQSAPGADRFAIDRRSKLLAVRAHRSQSYSTRRILARLEDPRRPAIEVSRSLQGPTPMSGPPRGVNVRSATERFDGSVDWVEQARRVTTLARDRSTLAGVLARQARRWTDDADVPPTRNALDRLRHPHSVCVVTGQQVGLLGGPAFTLTKAAATVALARRLRAQGIEAVPIFWMATQDHDVAEVDGVARLEGAPLRLGLPDTGGPVGRLRVEPAIVPVLDRWAEELARAPGVSPAAVAGVRARLGDVYHPGIRLSDAFARWLSSLFGGELLVLDPDDEAFARLARPLYRRALTEHAAVRDALHRARSRLRSAGEREVVPTGRDVSELFYLDQRGRRVRLTPEDGGVRWPGGFLDHEALADHLRRTPERFTPAALLRPVAQNAVFPTLAQIAGPTEARYLAQTDELHAWAGVPRAVVLRRPDVHLSSSRDELELVDVGGIEGCRHASRPSERLGRAGLDEAASGWLRTLDRCTELVLEARRRRRSGTSIDPSSIEATLTTLRTSDPSFVRSGQQRLDELDHQLLVLASSPDPTPGRPATTRPLTRMLRILTRLRRALLRAGRRRVPAAVAAWRRVSDHPAPPERRMSTAEALARFGADLPALLTDACTRNPSVRLAVQRGGSA